MAMRPLEKLPTIRAKLGSVIVFAVAMTDRSSTYVAIGFALRDRPEDAEAIDALALARRRPPASSTHHRRAARSIVRRDSRRRHRS